MTRPTLIALAALTLAVPGLSAGQERPPPPKDPPPKVAAPANDTHGTRPPPKDPPPKPSPKPRRSFADMLASFIGDSRSEERADPGDPPLKGSALPPVKGTAAPPVKGTPN